MSQARAQARQLDRLDACCLPAGARGRGLIPLSLSLLSHHMGDDRIHLRETRGPLQLRHRQVPAGTRMASRFGFSSQALAQDSPDGAAHTADSGGGRFKGPTASIPGQRSPWPAPRVFAQREPSSQASPRRTVMPSLGRHPHDPARSSSPPEAITRKGRTSTNESWGTHSVQAPPPFWLLLSQGVDIKYRRWQRTEGTDTHKAPPRPCLHCGGSILARTCRGSLPLCR